MRQVQFTLRTITPLFLSGAEPRSTPEIRPPSFRGAMRYWLRAALGGCFPNTSSSLERIRAIESDVFGSASDEERSGSSAITVRVSDLHLGNSIKYERTKAKRGESPGRDYLYWSMVDKSYIPPGSKFDLILNTRPGSKNAEKSLDYAVYSLWLLLHLGGIGSRSRRTAGSLAAVSPPTFDQLEFQLRPDTYAGIAQQLGESIANIRAGFNCSGQGGPFNKFSEFDVLHPQMCRIWLLGAWGSVEAAINNIGSRLREFRMLPGPDRMNVARWFDGEKIDTVERAVFGLPIQYRYLEKGARPVKVGSIQGRQRDPSIIRRSSPLWLKVVPVGDNYCGVATLFKSRFLPDQEGLHLQTGYKKVDPVPPPTDYSLIEQWVKDMFPKRVEVKYG